MNHPASLAIIGSGPSAIYLLKHLLDRMDLLKEHVAEISIFEKSLMLGMGMPYSPLTTDRYNMSNISSEELPELPETFAGWLRARDPSELKELDLEGVEISDSEVYSRLALGQYLQCQYETLVTRFMESGIHFSEYSGCEIADIQDHPDHDKVAVTTSKGTRFEFDRVIIATGHRWADKDRPEQGYYASPWPMAKLLPDEGEVHNFAIGTLGASLSAFDVISSLTHRHGVFEKKNDRMTYLPAPGTEDFKIIMHSSQGMLPHLQFDQVEPMREIYRHVDRDSLLGLLNANGHLRIETYFDKVCRPALSDAFQKDEMYAMVRRLADPKFSITDFVEEMNDKHDYDNAFEGMRSEMTEAEESVLKHQPVHWKEIMDDLMYTLNFHAELMPAEDHLLLHTKVMPFLLNVVAAMPLNSADTILALHEAGKLDIIPGNVTLPEDQPEPGLITVTVDDEGKTSTLQYRMFIDCSGQKPLDLDEYPFPSLVKSGTVRKARAPFDDDSAVDESVPDKKKEHLFKDQGDLLYHTGGIDIDGTYRVIGQDGEPNPRIYDIAFPHTPGVRPYSYGLQACSDTSAIVVAAWVEELQADERVKNNPAEIMQIYEKV
ncbi:FAD/NAD(P)-binding protein [Prosthecobacter sp. SYSU 5D2]|uniref:FAD/NAD(P)-binding protein n=1 Tax=Prosthecobacter sp. SYSU 5D2 TaxID=3134134 RepID=UPI0031FF2614